MLSGCKHQLWWQNLFVLLASYVFYGWWNWRFLILIAITSLSSWATALGIEKSQNRKKPWLIVNIILNLGVLATFKYYNFFVSSFCSLFGLDSSSFVLNLLLPVGISFYTFQALSYSIDVYRRQIDATKDIVAFFAYIAFFPQLVAGPIERIDNLLPQIKAEHKLNAEDMYAGFKIALGGFFRKCVVADFCGIFVNNVFGNVAEANALSVFIAGVLFAIQMYNDFAGYSDIATGVARMMGVRLMKNFDRPYLSQSFTEFFRRWHISLTKWFTDYVYIPLGGSRKGTARKIFNTFVVFLLCGLWHGANWTYVLWGLYSAIILAIENVCRKPFGKFCEKHKIDLQNQAIVLFRRAILFLLVVFGAFIFRSQSVGQLGEVLTKLFTGFGKNFVENAFVNLDITVMDILQIAISVICMSMIPRLWEEGEDTTLPINTIQGKSVYMQRISTCVYLILAVAFCWLALAASSDVSSFAYFQF
jgi:D-alanyl-lipoteichoic acid acyltransferase DltB (MBOAT superfamily)